LDQCAPKLNLLNIYSAVSNIVLMEIHLYYCFRGEIGGRKDRRTETTASLNLAAEWLALLFRIRNVLDSNLDPETGYPGEGFRDFSQSLEANAGIVPQIRPTYFPSLSFPINNSLIIVSYLQPRTADKGWSSSLAVGREVNNSPT
jgi:hypothetical protein